MFDIGFQEIVLIGVIALLVVGPERLPALARTAGLYINRLRRMVTEVRADVENELRTEEVRRAMAEFKQADELKDLVAEAKDSLNEVRDSLDTAHEELDEAYDEAHSALRDVRADAQADGPGVESEGGAPAAPSVLDQAMGRAASAEPAVPSPAAADDAGSAAAADAPHASEHAALAVQPDAPDAAERATMAVEAGTPDAGERAAVTVEADTPDAVDDDDDDKHAAGRGST